MENGNQCEFSYNKNELLDLAGVNEIIDGYMINRIGEPYQSFYVYEVDGLFKSDEEAAAYENSMVIHGLCLSKAAIFGLKMRMEMES